ncbi:hypothetical protein [Faecalibacter macacae]|uniref:Uncharacterized protein n=1 Tax=Faecalibacter macacae TaxID=1859289 RepID=A0A3L9MGD0_9FLAO|nr:hypothetical protein [Faecalibacter macacae]RLZ12013.1 hypothetical protein EAH69_03635 [Faecalibacter macacae]
MKELRIVIFITLLLVVFLSFTTIIQSDLKVIRYKKVSDGFLVIEYFDGVIKKQVKRNQLTKHELTFSEKNEIEKEISKLNVDLIISEIDTINKPILGVSYMYLFIKNKDTLRTRFYPEGATPKQLQRVDYLMNKNRK